MEQSINYENGLMIGRYQLRHTGHEDAIIQAKEKGVKKFIIGVGSSNKELTENNPFTLAERTEIIKLSLKSCLNQDQYVIKGIPDFEDKYQWRNHVMEEMPRFDCLITGNPYVKEIFNEINIPTISLKHRKLIKASHLRHQIFMESIQELQQSLNQDVINYLYEIKAFERMKNIMKAEQKGPRVAVDGFILDKTETKVLMIKRKYPPYGRAFPGGMVEYGESIETALLRELKEELNIEAKIIGNPNIPAFVGSDPDRDPRNHVLSCVFNVKIIGGEIQAGDDALSHRRIEISEIISGKEPLAFDHASITNEIVRNFGIKIPELV